MNKKIYLGFILLLTLLMIEPLMNAQYRQDANNVIRLATSVDAAHYNYIISITDDVIDGEFVVDEFIRIADATNVSLFYQDPSNSFYLEGYAILPYYYYLNDDKYLDNLLIRDKIKAEEFNNSEVIYATDSSDNKISMVMDRDVITVTSLKNFEGLLYGPLTVASSEIDAISTFREMVNNEIQGIELISNEYSYIDQEAHFKDFINELKVIFGGNAVFYYGVIVLTLLLILIQFNTDSKKIIIKKSNGYSDLAIMLEYLKEFIPPLFIVGTLVFLIAFPILGGNYNFSFIMALLKYEFVLILFSVVIVLLTIFSIAYITTLHPVNLVKGKKSSKVMIAYSFTIKILVLFILVPAMLIQIIEVRETWKTYKYMQEEQEVFENAYRIDTLNVFQDMEIDHMEVYEKMEDSEILFSEELNFTGGGLDEDLPLVITNSAMINRHKLKSNGEIIEVPQGEQVLIISNDLLPELIKEMPIYKDDFLTMGDLNQEISSNVEIIRLDPGQEFIVTSTLQRTVKIDRFVITANTFLPLGLTDFFYMDLSLGEIEVIEETLNRDYAEKTFKLSPYLDERTTSYRWALQSFVESTLSLMILLFAMILTTVLFYTNIIELQKKKLVVTFMHGTNIYVNLFKPLLLALTANLIFALISWRVSLLTFNFYYFEQFTLSRLAIVLLTLCILEFIVWALVIHLFDKKKIEVLKDS